MKLFTNLPGNLRALFGFLRIAAVVGGFVGLVVLPFNMWAQDRFGIDIWFGLTVGDVALPVAPNAVHLQSDGANPGTLTLESLRGTLRVKLLKGGDAALASALRWTVFPGTFVVSLFSYLLLTALRNLCAEIEAGEVFSENNLRLVRKIGWILIWYSVAAFAVNIWLSVVMGNYFNQHVTMSGIEGTVSFPAVGKWSFSGAPFPGNLGLVTGCLVLMLTEAFRQGLKLKQETDLTV